jgi:DNA-binding MarR family transcriptional regulator
LSALATNAISGSIAKQFPGWVSVEEKSSTEILNLWRGALVESVRRDSPDLSARQMALLLTVYLTPPPHTVRGLAETLNISKPAITRALDRLSTLEMLRRKPDEKDRRSIDVQRTVKGSVYLSEFSDLIRHALPE